ncbi:hypothetical protein F4820DRAFT_428426 [Hypoxylon rubiginosum]|uniref:Uncharacterized protein n=1 Tax=Hypoxylon rubiginosum TaxID=110542 RepID=A0ACB9YUA5_9PEZI|nr:hypothetical protein F4820DRAFT_428426 [Hypoxylon rubiginosum]
MTSKIDTLLSCCLYEKDLLSIAYIPRFKHRLSILSALSIPPGSRILDIGCGQGESSLALALELGPSSHITGIDTAIPDYGGPFTVRESHEHVAKSALGPQISFHLQMDAASFLQSPDSCPASNNFDAAVLCHSLWYFPTCDSVFSLFETLAEAGMPTIYLAEYDFDDEPALPSQVPHLLAARAQALFHAYKAPREAERLELNVRAAPDKKTVMEAVSRAGYVVSRQGTLRPAEDFLEGHFEARYIQSDKFPPRVRAEGLPEEQVDEILAYGPRVKKALEDLKANGIEKGRSMDVWWAEIELKR